MKARVIKEGVYWVGAVDWNRRLFDSLIPLPDGTSYNAYLVQGSEKTALLDAVDPSMADILLSHLRTVENIDYIVANHAEQDHSGAIPHVLGKFKNAQVVTTPKGKELLIDLLHIPEERFLTVQDGETLSLGDKTLTFIHLPWVHWPETMATYLQGDNILFSCDLFGSHLATSDLYANDEGRVYEAAKRYYAEIMMPFRTGIQKHLEKLSDYEISMIAPSHGPIYHKPAFILDAYRDWVSSDPRNVVVLSYVSMHGSCEKMVDHLVAALSEKGVTVEQFNLAVTDIGKLAMALVDAASIVIATPTVLAGAHPHAVYAAYLVNALRPKLKFAIIIGSYGWGSKAVEQLTGMISSLKVKMFDPILCKGLPKEADFKALDNLAANIAQEHKQLGLT